jgi:SurA N-terminal domain
VARLAAAAGLAALLVALVTGVGASGAEVPSSTCPPPAAASSTAAAPGLTSPAAAVAPSPEQVLVCVNAQAITGATYTHWLTVAKKSEGPVAKGHHAATATELQSEVLGFLISSDWVKAEAQARGMSVSTAEVRKRFDRIRDQQFPRRGEFDAFLRKSGQTVMDLMFRVELNLLSQRIQKSVTAGHRSASSRGRALSQFVKAFTAKWRAQTYCASEYAVADCGHVQATV